LKELLGRLIEASANRSAAANFLYIVFFLFVCFFCVAFSIIIISYVRERLKRRHKKKIKPAEVIVLSVASCLILLVFVGICMVVASVCIAIREAL
jgi:amino acid transporter